MKYVLSALKVVPAIAAVIEKVDAQIKVAKKAESEGGPKITEKEVGTIVLSSIGPLVKAITALFVAVHDGE